MVIAATTPITPRVIKTSAKVKPALENSEIKKIVYNYKDLLHKLNKFNIELNGVTDDVLIERYLIKDTSLYINV